MSKPGRNDPCPCGSGLKYKKCCLPVQESKAQPPEPSQQETLIRDEVRQLQAQAAAKRPGYKLFGTLFFFATERGDAWLLELTEQDALKVASDGTPLPVKIEESEEDLQIGWTHNFEVDQGRLQTRAISGGNTETIYNSPITVIKDIQKKFRRKFSEKELQRIHRET